MALSIPEIVRQFKADVATAISAETIEKICGSVGHSWRNRVLDPVTTVHVFLLQILHGNVACTALPRLAEVSFTATAYCKARSRLPLALFQKLLLAVCKALSSEMDKTARWFGHRTWFIDGSGFSMSDTPELAKHFGYPSGQTPGCGFPQAHLLMLIHAGTGMIQRVLASARKTHDMRHAATMHPQLKKNDILIADRGFASYAHLALLFMRQMHGVFRCHQKQHVDFRVNRKHAKKGDGQKGLPRSRYVKRLGYHDQLVEYVKPDVKPKWMDDDTFARLPEKLLIRELRYKTHQKGHRTKEITLVTTLLDPVIYLAEELAKLYLSRWQIELNLRHLKTTMGMEVLHCKKVEGVLKELYMYALVYNLVRLVMLRASKKQKVPLDRISFIDALRWLRDSDEDSELTPLVINPARPNRLEPRVIKRRKDRYTFMTKRRDVLRKALIGKKEAA